jgi:hypothetical protein
MMIHPDIHSALARERISTFLAQAEAARRTRHLRRPAKSRRVRLRDGLAMLIRPVRPADDGLLPDGFAGLSGDHGATGALDHARGGGVGIARYVRDRDDPCAEDNRVMAGSLRSFEPRTAPRRTGPGWCTWSRPGGA